MLSTMTLLSLSLVASASISQTSAEPVKTIPPAQLVPYPPMQWHSWNLFCGEGLLTDADMREMAQALINTGMAAAGYDTVNLVCQGWGHAIL